MSKKVEQVDLEEDEIDLWEILTVIWKRKNIIIWFLIATILVVSIWRLASKRVYSGKAVVTSSVLNVAEFQFFINDINSVLGNKPRFLELKSKYPRINGLLKVEVSDVTLDEDKNKIFPITIRITSASKIDIPNNLDFIVHYITNNKKVDDLAERKRQQLKVQIDNIREAITTLQHDKYKIMVILSKGNLKPLGLDLTSYITKIIDFQNTLSKLNDKMNLFKIVDVMNEPQNTVSPVPLKTVSKLIVGVIISLFISLIVIFIIEGIEKHKNVSGN